MEDQGETKNIEFYSQYFKEEDRKQPYGNTQEYLHDLFCIMDAGLQTIIYLLTLEEGYNFPLKGILLPANKVYDVIHMNAVENGNLTVSDGLICDFNKMESHIRERKKRKDGMESHENRLEVLSETFHLTRFEIFTLLLALSVEYSRGYETIYAFIQNDLSESFPTKGLALTMYQLLYLLNLKEQEEFLYDKGKAADIFLVVSGNKGGFSDKLILERFITEYLLYGSEYPEFPVIDSEIFHPSKYLPEIVIRQEIEKKLHNLYVHTQLTECTDLRNKKLTVIIIGREGNGRSYLVKHFSRKIQKNVLFISLKDLIYLKTEEIKNKILKLNGYGQLMNTIVCVRLTNETVDNEHISLIRRILQYLEETLDFWFIISTPETKDSLSGLNHALYIPISWPDGKEKAALWEEYKKGYHFHEEVELSETYNKYSLSVREIKQVLHTARAVSVSRGRDFIGTEDIIKAVRQGEKMQLGRYAAMINADFSWEDLIIDKKQKELIALICSHIQYKGIVGTKWGFYKKMPYGRGVSAVFHGTPGTGKTMAAQIMAGKLQMDLYRIDLSQLVSKYIGETEKNISELFDKARYMNVVLFFDEADSLFAKRLEVKDSNDRNANSMTAHLLQKFEEYEGIIILATNYINNIDEAFKRRIKFMVPFSFPDKEARYTLFQSIMPEETPCDECLDFKYFSEHFELSGSSIKEVLVNAAYMAAREGTGMKNKHVMEAIKLNYMKYGRIIRDNEFGYLS